MLDWVLSIGLMAKSIVQRMLTLPKGCSVYTLGVGQNNSKFVDNSIPFHKGPGFSWHDRSHPAACEELVDVPLRLLGKLRVVLVIPGLDVGLVQGEQRLVDVVGWRGGGEQSPGEGGARSTGRRYQWMCTVSTTMSMFFYIDVGTVTGVAEQSPREGGTRSTGWTYQRMCAVNTPMFLFCFVFSIYTIIDVGTVIILTQIVCNLFF